VETRPHEEPDDAGNQTGEAGNGIGVAGDPIGRRRFLSGASLTLVAGLAACSGGTHLAAGASGAAGGSSTGASGAPGGSSTEGAAGTPTTGTPTTGKGPFAVLVDTFDFIVGVDQRVAVALADPKGNPITPAQPVTVQIRSGSGPFGPPQPASVHTDGMPAYVLTSYRFPTAGPYTIRVISGGRHADLAISAIAPSSTPIPFAGKPLLSVPTPTFAAPLGVSPVCTSQPACPFHTVSLDQALGQTRTGGLPFATPALCQSRLCGPVLDNLVAVHQPFATDITFIHCEIYTDLSGQKVTAPVSAYHLEHEPLLFLAGADGIVRERIDNGFDRVEGAAALHRLMTG
jgi:hypothetical protein